MDTDASVRAMAPSSVFGGSRESLPLSVLSGNDVRNSMSGVPGGTGGGATAGERASIYSTSGLIASERNSYYSKQQDAKSLRSVSNLRGVGMGAATPTSAPGGGASGGAQADDARSISIRSGHGGGEGRFAADARSLRSFDARSGLSLGEERYAGGGGGGGAIHARNGSLSGIVAEEVGRSQQQEDRDAEDDESRR